MQREIKELEGQLSEKENCKTNQRARRKIELEGKLKEKSKSQKENRVGKKVERGFRELEAKPESWKEN